MNVSAKKTRQKPEDLDRFMEAASASDVGLPGMNGRELAGIARAHRPDLPILFITGYAENAADRAGFLGENMALVTKPFRLDDLAAKISEMVEAPAGRADGTDPAWN